LREARLERQRERAEGPRPRESGETERELRLDGDEGGRVGVEARRWRHDDEARTGGLSCEWSVGSVSGALERRVVFYNLQPFTVFIFFYFLVFTFLLLLIN
jgi:hypothetical protein